jgi:hypothetical protein
VRRKLLPGVQREEIVSVAIMNAGGETLGMFAFSDALFGMLLLWLRAKRPSDGARSMRPDAIAQFWAQKLAENQQILAMIDGDTFTGGDRRVLDAETLAEVRQWAAQRVAECEARIAERQRYY